MSTHRFILEPYKGVSTRHTCPNCHRKRCFSKYIDTEKQIQFPDYVGRCDHEQKCGYHFTPRDYFERNPSEKEKLSEDTFRNYTPIKEVEPKVTSYIDLDIVATLSRQQTVSILIGSIRRGRDIEADGEIQSWYFQTLGWRNCILANGLSEQSPYR